MRILGIDTSGKVASVAVMEDSRLLWEKSVYTTLTHSQVILPMVEQALSENRGNQSLTARRLGISRSTLWRILSGKEQKAKEQKENGPTALTRE